MVALQAPPLTVRVGVIIGSTLFVGLEDALLCLGRIQSIAFADPLDPVGERRVNEHVQAAGITAQRIIGAPPDNNAVLLPGNLLDHFKERQEHLLGERHILHPGQASR